MRDSNSIPLVSVVTICWNEGERIRETAESVLAQTHPRVEWIVADGESTDGTLEILRSYGDRVAKLESRRDGGVYAAQNRGARHATGQFLLFLNGGDSFADPRAIESLVAASASVDLVYGDLVAVHEDGREEALRAPDAFTFERLMRDTVWHPTALISADLFRRAGPYDESYRIAADYDFFLKAFFRERARATRCPRPIARFRMGGISSKPENQAKVAAERRRAQEAVLGPLVVDYWERRHAEAFPGRARTLARDCARQILRALPRPVADWAIRLASR